MISDVTSYTTLIVPCQQIFKNKQVTTNKFLGLLVVVGKELLLSFFSLIRSTQLISILLGYHVSYDAGNNTKMVFVIVIFLLLPYYCPPRDSHGLSVFGTKVAFP